MPGARPLRGRPFLAVPLAALAMSGPVAAQEDGLEYAIKATFLYKFAPFVEWPEGEFASPVSPFTICVTGNDPVARLTDQVVRGQHIGDRPIMISHVAGAETARTCQVLYVGGSDDGSLAALNGVRGAPVLTVSDSALGSAAVAIIRFVVEDNKVRFDIDEAAAAQAGLTISSKLLSLARRVTPRPAERRP